MEPYLPAVLWRLEHMTEDERRRADARVARVAPLVARLARTVARMVQLGDGSPYQASAGTGAAACRCARTAAVNAPGRQRAPT